MEDMRSDFCIFNGLSLLKSLTALHLSRHVLWLKSNSAHTSFLIQGKSLKQRFNIIRMMYKQLPTMHRNFTWGKASTEKCPLCNHSCEDHTHIFACSHPTMTAFRNEQIHYVIDQLWLVNTCPVLLRQILCNLRKAQYPQSTWKTISSSTNNPIIQSINFAQKRQYTIGIINFMHGLITYSFGDCQEP